MAALRLVGRRLPGWRLERLGSTLCFMPYSPLNIKDAYNQDKTLEDVWAHPFFARIREWQRKYGYKKKARSLEEFGCWIMPCPIRDHHLEFRPLIRDLDLTPEDYNAAAAFQESGYLEGMVIYNRAGAKVIDPIWRNEYPKLVS